MANRCATLDEFLLQASEFATVGSVSTSTVTFTANPSAGQTITVTDPYSLPNVITTLTAVAAAPAANQFLIGATPTDTAANFAAAVNLGTNAINALVIAGGVGTIITLVTRKTGSASRFTISTTSGGITLSGSMFTGGSLVLQTQLDCACMQINLECFGDLADCAHIYLTGHYMSVISGIGATGAVSSRQIDKISEDYAVAAPKAGDDLASTKWGRMYLQLRQSLLITPIAARTNLPMVI